MQSFSAANTRYFLRAGRAVVPNGYKSGQDTISLHYECRVTFEVWAVREAQAIVETRCPRRIRLTPCPRVPRASLGRRITATPGALRPKGSRAETRPCHTLRAQLPARAANHGSFGAEAVELFPGRRRFEVKAIGPVSLIRAFGPTAPAGKQGGAGLQLPSHVG
jgi:hypothetical protein